MIRWNFGEPPGFLAAARRSRYNRGMSDEAKRRWRPWAWIGWTLFALLVLYPLSIGPFGRFAIRHNVYEAIYGPIEWAGRRYDPVFNVVKWYVDLWGD